MCLCVCVYASVHQIMTAIISDIKRVVFDRLCSVSHCKRSSCHGGGEPLLRAALSHDSCSIYMFTLTISICCFWNNQQQGPGREKHRETAVSRRAQLGFHDWEAGADYGSARRRVGGGGGRQAGWMGGGGGG